MVAKMMDIKIVRILRFDGLTATHCSFAKVHNNTAGRGWQGVLAHAVLLAWRISCLTVR